MKPAGALIKIRLTWAGDGDFPSPGDWLQTRTGRKYEIESVRGIVCVCRVLRDDFSAPPGVAVHCFRWNSRKRK